MAGAATLDHIVVNARMDMDRCEEQFRELGFQMTPRGYHTLGSINALAIFQTDYLELLGLPPGKEEARPELSGAPAGLNGVVFKTDDADATYTHLQSLGITANEPKSFSRPVTLADGATRDVKFRTVTLASEIFPAGRFYFCEHGTPDLVWRPEWQAHANGTTGFAELAVVTADPATLSEKIAAVLKVSDTSQSSSGIHAVETDGFTLSFQTIETYRDRFGALASDLDGRREAIGAAVVNAAVPESVLDTLRSRPDAYATGALAEGTGVRVQAFDTLIVFSSIASN